MKDLSNIELLISGKIEAFLPTYGFEPDEDGEVKDSEWKTFDIGDGWTVSCKIAMKGTIKKTLCYPYQNGQIDWSVEVIDLYDENNEDIEYPVDFNELKGTFIL